MIDQKVLKGSPHFLLNILTVIHKKINTVVLSRLTKVMKHFCRGEQLLEENFIDITSIYSKQSDTLFCLKEVCAASLKRTELLDFHGIV